MAMCPIRLGVIRPGPGSGLGQSAARAFRMKSMKLSRVAGLAGIAGPVLFTAGWLASSLRQAAPMAQVQLSGLAAEDARDPQLMMAAFIVLGGCSICLGAGLRQVGPRSAGPWLVMLAGGATVAAGVFRRDHLLLTGPGFAGESWHNQVHDVVSAVAYAGMLAAPLLLAWRLRRGPGWAGISRAVTGLAVASAVGLAVFASRVAEPWNGAVQKGAVTLALAAEVLLAAGLLRYRGASAGPLATAHLAANDAKPSTSDSSTNSPRTGTAAPSSSSSGAKWRSTAS
jgi:hypothetical protein